MVNQYFEKLRRFTLDYWADTDARVYLFGSWARGEQRRSSDVDIAIAGDADTAGRIADFREKLEESCIIYNVDVVDMNFASQRLKDSIMAEGIAWKS